MNKTILDEIKNQDYQTITKIFEDFLKSQVSKSNAKGLIFGLSGGIDSAVIAYLCARVFKNNSLALLLPDSKITPKIDTDDAVKMAEYLGINYKLLDINSIFSEYEKHLEHDEKSFGNLRARIRANLLYYYANLKNYLVVGSS
ncbi:MAG: NAD(+) synthase, partial [Nitrosopumilaceae archaeon]